MYKIYFSSVTESVQPCQLRKIMLHLSFKWGNASYLENQRARITASYIYTNNNESLEHANILTKKSTLCGSTIELWVCMITGVVG